jgi:hypothetical protein
MLDKRDYVSKNAGPVQTGVVAGISRITEILRQSNLF